MSETDVLLAWNSELVSTEKSRYKNEGKFKTHFQDKVVCIAFQYAQISMSFPL